MSYIVPLLHIAAVALSLISIGFAVSAIRLTREANRRGDEVRHWLGGMNRHLAEMRENLPKGPGG